MPSSFSAYPNTENMQMRGVLERSFSASLRRAERRAIRPPQLARGRSPGPHFRAPTGAGITKGKSNMKTRKFAFRIGESDYQMLKTKAKRGKITMTDLIIRAITDKEIVVVDGVRELLGELKAIGRNLNQLTTLANMGRIDTAYLTETKAQLNQIYEKLSAICEVEQ